MPRDTMQPTSGIGKKRPRSRAAIFGSSDEDEPIEKNRAETTNEILQKYKDDALAACSLGNYPEAYEQVKQHISKTYMASPGNRVSKPSTQLPYQQLKCHLNHNDLNFPASLAEAVRIMCPNHEFTRVFIAQMISLGWDPALICDPTKSANQRLAASKEEQMKKYGVDKASVDKYEGTLIPRKRLADVDKHGSVDGDVGCDLEMVKGAHDATVTLHMTKLQDQFAALQQQLTEINSGLTEVHRQSNDTHRSQMAEVQSQLTEIHSKMAETHNRLIDICQSQIIEMQHQSSTVHHNQMAEMQRLLNTTHRTQMAEMQRQLTSTHETQMAEMQRHLTSTHQGEMAEIQRHLARLIPSSPPVPELAYTNGPGISFTGPEPSAYHQQYQQHDSMTHGMPMFRRGCGYQETNTPSPFENGKMGHPSP